jgi:hypothetical protein
MSRCLRIEITRTRHSLLLIQQRLVDSIYDKANLKAYIGKYNVAPMEVPIKLNRLKKATELPTPGEHWHLELKNLPFRSLLGAEGYLMTSNMPSIAYAYKEISRFADQRPDYRQEHVIATRTHHFHQEGSDTAFHRCRWEGDELTLAALSDADCPEQLELHTLLKASIQQLSTVPSATVRAKDDAEHALHIFQRELELDAATMLTDSAST